MSVEHLEPPLSLGGSFTIEQVAELQQHLLEHVPNANSLCLEQISEIDCAGLQLLLAIKQQYPHLQWLNPSAAIRELLARLQLSYLLNA